MKKLKRCSDDGPGALNLVKLCVGADRPEDLEAWIASGARQSFPDGKLRHVTRMWPKRESALLQGGSLYWVFSGRIEARQSILGFDEIIGEDGIHRCGIVLQHDLIRTRPLPRRAFQGWRYLPGEDAPSDLVSDGNDADIPAELAHQLSDIGVI